MKIDDMVPSKSNFLTKEDVGEEGVNLTIAKFKQEEVGFENDKELKFCIYWVDPNFKPMVLNKENATRLKMICKTDDTDQMIGKTVNVYNDPFVKFGKELKGGIRIRPVQHAEYAAQNPRPAPAAPEPGMGQPTPPIEAYNESDVPW